MTCLNRSSIRSILTFEGITKFPYPRSSSLVFFKEIAFDLVTDQDVMEIL